MDNQAALFSPPGRWIEVGGRKLHWREWGTPSDLPPLLLECGLAMMSAVWAWLAPLLAPHTRVLAWDRPGLGWSEPHEIIPDANQTALTLHESLSALGISTPVVMLGHSLGALIARAAFARSPQSFAGLIFLDGSHPHQMRNPKLRRRMRNFFLALEAANLLASRGLPRLNLPLANELEHLPEPDRSHALHFLKHPAHLRATAREARAWNQSCATAASVSFGELPLLVISAQKHGLPGWPELQRDLLTLSARSTHITFTDATHISLLSHQDHARKVADAILGWLRNL